MGDTHAVTARTLDVMASDVLDVQPELAALIAAGGLRSEVLDAGCGHAELSLSLAADGYQVVGLDISPTAIAAANRAAQARNLRNAAFAQVDITVLTGYDGRFSTVVDGALLHSLPDDRRHDYLHAVQRAAAPGARFYALVPEEVGEVELRDTVAAHWVVDEIRPAFIHTADVRAPAFLLTAHK